MGAEYYAINKQNKTFYDLGKGGWYALTDMEAFQDEEYLCNEILVECYNIDEPDYWSYYPPEKKDEVIHYVKTRITPELFIMMKDTPPNKIKIVSDSVDDITICKVKRYRGVGTRYYEIGSAEHGRAIEMMNRHLEDTPINKRWYNPENYKNILEFNEY